MTLTLQALRRGNREVSTQPDRPADDRERTPVFRLPHGLLSARFGLLIVAALIAGLVALLAINTSLAAGAIEVSGLESSLARTTERQQALQVEVDGLSSPAALQASAMALGMVPAAAPAFLDPATGGISGVLVKADAAGVPTAQAPQVKPPEPEPAAIPSPGTGASIGAGLEPDAQLVMPPDPGADGAIVTRPPAVAPTVLPTVAPPTGPTEELPGGDAAALLEWTP